MNVKTISSTWVERVRIPGGAARPAIVRRLTRGAFWVMAGTVVWRVLTAVSTIFVARILGRDAFGELSMVRSTVDLFVVFGSFRLGSTATKYVSEYRNTDPLRAGSVLLLVTSITLITCTIMAVSSLVLSSWLAEHVMNRADLAPMIMLSTLLIFFATLEGVHEVALAGFEAFRGTAYVNALRGLLAVTLCVPFAYVWGIRGVVMALAIDSALAFGLCALLLRRECVKHRVSLRRTWRSVLAEAPILWKFALPGVCAGVVIAGAMWVGRIILVHEPDGYTELGLFSAANQWRTPILFFSAVLSTVMLPVLSEAYSRDSREDMAAAIGANLKTVCMTALPVALVIMCFARPIQSLFGAEFRQSSTMLRILMPATFFYALDRVFERVLDGTGRRWTGLALTAGWSLVFMVTALLAVPKLGGAGLALALLVAYAALAAGRMAYVNRVLAPGSVRRHMGLLLLCVLSLMIAFLASLGTTP